jgi:hypothetical protein
MAQDARGLTNRWRELDRLDAEIERRRSELRLLVDQPFDRKKQGISGER